MKAYGIYHHQFTEAYVVSAKASLIDNEWFIHDDTMTVHGSFIIDPDQIVEDAIVAANDIVWYIDDDGRAKQHVMEELNRLTLSVWQRS